MRRVIALAVALGCGDSSPAIDAAPDDAVCKAELESALDRTCTVETECTLVASADCCGTVMLAVRAGTEAGFATLEARYEACLACPPVGCMHADQAEDGRSPQAGQVIAAACNGGRCASVVR